MSIFATILHKIMSAATAVLPADAQPRAIPAATVPSAPAGGGAELGPIATDAGTADAGTADAGTTDAGGAGVAPAAAAPVDVEAVLTALAAQKGGGGNWRTSIVDLLKLLDLDSSLEARTQLAAELGTHVAADGSAAQNIALHKAVMQKVAENGGTVPDSMKG